ncbi:MAG: diaminopimelate dehydrogenase [Ruminococcus sp.]|nr:diaminopimelate dehydrogenase [Ruminococcus sp.]
MSKIRIGIAGYGNLGKGVELAIRQNDDMELAGIFTRRDPSTVNPLTEGARVYKLDDAEKMKNDIDVMIICGGSATDLPEQTPELAKNFNVIDSFDTHARIPEHFANVDKVCKETGHLAMISLGWDPGLFSLNRLYAESILPNGKSYTFWGKGVSQGHSDAIRRVEGVKKGIQYTVPVEAAMDAVRSGSQPELSTREKHERVCYVVPEEGADKAKIEETIKSMKNYFDQYNTTVNFITDEEFDAVHNKMPHGGFVMRSGLTGDGEKTHQMIEYSLKLESNPEFTSSVLVCYARALSRLKAEGAVGCKTAFDIAPAYLSRLSGEELRAAML